MNVKRFQLLGMSIALSAVFLYFALKGMDWNALGHTLANVKLTGLVFCLGMIALVIFLRSWRWSMIAPNPAGHLLPYFRATNLGNLGNLLLPARLGEVVRIVAIKRMLKMGLSESVGSTLIDRIIDVVVLVLSAWFISLFLVKSFLPQGWLLGLGTALATLVAGLFVIRSHLFHTWLSKWSVRYLHRWSLRPDSFVMVFNNMIGDLVKWRRAILLLGSALLVWIADYLVILSALLCFGIDLPPLAPLLLWVALAVGSALPSAPGYVGIYQLAAVLALATYDVPAHEAVAVSLILQGLTLLVSLLIAGGEVKWLFSKDERHFGDKTS